MKTDNRSVGNHFEQDMANILFEHGFWVHIMQQTKSGQPADIIAVKGRYHTLIDCKVVSDNNGFSFDRIEENQKFAMRVFHKRCLNVCYFAIRLPDGEIRMVSMDRIETIKNRGKRKLTENELKTQAWPLDKWLDSSETWAEDV